jgi:uncharacterized protein YjiS (DUF1127 family)
MASNKSPAETSPALRRAAHTWREKQKTLIAASGDTAVQASAEYRRASRKLAAVVDHDMRSGSKD